MQIQRCLTKTEGNYMPFGAYIQVLGYDFNWFIGNNKIGITSHYSTESELFIAGFLVCDAKLMLLTPLEELEISVFYPQISRVDDSDTDDSRRRIRGIRPQKKETTDLIEMLTDNEIIYVYSSNLKYRGGLWEPPLTFSPEAPPAELYYLGKTMPIEIDTEELEFYKQFIRTE